MPTKTPHAMYFVAIVCPVELDKKVRHLKEWMREQYGCKVALRSPAHITLVPPFWFDLEKEEFLLDDFKSFYSDLNPFDIYLHGFSHFSNRVIFISVNNNESLNILQQQSDKYFLKYQSAVKTGNHRPFTPHVTIANRDLRPGDFIKAWERFSKLTFEENFLANRIALLKLGIDGWHVLKDKPWN